MARPVDKIAAKKLDPVTFEILRHRIEEIVGEMYHTIARVSGNLVVIAAGDHQEGLLNAQGEAVLVSGGIVEWETCLEAGGKYLTQSMKTILASMAVGRHLTLANTQPYRFAQLVQSLFGKRPFELTHHRASVFSLHRIPPDRLQISVSKRSDPMEFSQFPLSFNEF